MSAGDTFDARMARVEALLSEIEAGAEPEQLERAREVIGTILELHRVGLARVVERLSGTDGERALSALRRDDPLVGSLFDLHGLAPLDLPTGTTSDLVQLRRKKPVEPADGRGQGTNPCEICAAALPGRHDHLFERATAKLVCACDACAVAGLVGHVRVRRRARFLPEFVLSDATWDALGIPVQLAFLARTSRAAHPLARYPSPAGPIESAVPLEAWRAVEADNPILGTMDADVEALVVWRTRTAREHYLVSIDVGYELVGLVRREGPSALVSRAAGRTVEEALRELKAASERAA